jgi:hypothetical protein
MNFSGLWAGLGCESGGEVIGGISQQQGALFSYGDLLATPERVRYCAFDQRAATVGAGLGGAFGFNFLIGVNAPHPQMFAHSMEWGADLSIDLAIAGLSHYLRTLPEMFELAAITRSFSRTGLTIANWLTSYDKNRYLIKDAIEGFIKNCPGLVATQGGPEIISLPLPGASWGLRLSIKAKLEGVVVTSYGTFSFLH